MIIDRTPIPSASAESLRLSEKSAPPAYYDKRALGLGASRKSIASTSAVIATVQLSGLGLSVGERSIRPEHVIPVCLVLALLRRGYLGRNLHRLALLYLPFLWYLTVSILGAPDALGSMQSAMALLIATTALPYFVVLGEKLGGWNLLRLWLAVGTALNVAAILLFVTGIAGTQTDVTNGHIVAKGLAYEANIFGSQAAALAIVGLTLRSSVDWWVRPSIGINTIALALSQARGAWIAFGVVLLALAVANRSSVVPQLISVLGIVVVSAVALYTNSQLPLPVKANDRLSLTDLHARAQSLTDTSTGTGAVRVRTWQLAVDDIRKYPLAGSGINSYAALHGDITRPGHPGYLSNMYLAWLHDGGIIGALLICISIVGYLILIGGIPRAFGNPAMIALLVLGIAYVATDSSWIAWPWALAGVAFTYHRCL